MRIEDQILAILNEDAPEYEVVGGPTPSEVQSAPLDYAKPLAKATVPQTQPSNAAPVTEDEAADDDKKDDASDDDKKEVSECDDDSDKKDDEDKKDTLEETFAALLARLMEEEEAEKKDDEDKSDDEEIKEDEAPQEILPTVDSKLDDPASLVNQAPGSPVAEDEDKDSEDEDKDDLKEDAPEEILPTVDSKLDDPASLVNQAPGSPVAEEEDKDSDDDKKDEDKTDVSEDINAIFAGVKLSEEAKAKAALVFKAAVARQVTEQKTAIAKKAAAKLNEGFAALTSKFEKKQVAFENKLSEQVDSYMNYVVENWMKENRLAVERGIRAELAENFISGLKKLFVENYIEVPQSKVDVVATLGNKVAKLESKLDESVKANVQMKTTLNTYRKEEVVRTVSAGLTATQADKLSKLAEGVEYTNRKEFTTKLNALKESYFPKVAAPKAEEPLMETKKKPELNDEMSLYTQAISKSKK